jgi:hypothetical protein
MVMASRYNSSPLPAEVMVDGTRAIQVRQREAYSDLTAHEMEPVDVLGAKSSFGGNAVQAPQSGDSGVPTFKASSLQASS